MLRRPLTSSTLISAGYDDHKKILELQFISGEIYHYFGVPPEIYVGLINASSHGQYFNIYIRDAGYEFEKVT